jgi:hypothetical protein
MPEQVVRREPRRLHAKTATQQAIISKTTVCVVPAAVHRRDYTTGGIHLDHRVPLRWGGTDIPAT